jgi:putative membrane protein
MVSLRTLGALLAALLLAVAAAPVMAHELDGSGVVRLPPLPEGASIEDRRLRARQAAVILSAEPLEHRIAIAEAWSAPENVFADLDLHISVVIGVLIVSGLYALGVGPLRRRFGWAPAVPWRNVVFFAASMALLLASLNGPIHHLSDFFLFTGHMVQHMLIAIVFPLLLLLGMPGWLLRPLVRPRPVFAAASVLTRPLVAFVLYNTALVIWHIPGVYELALRHHDIHIFQHMSLIVLGVLAMWPFLSPLPELPRIPYVMQLVYLFFMQVPMFTIGAFVTLSDEVLYPFYEAAPRVIAGFDALADQRLGGLVMWLPGHLIYWIPMAIIFANWWAAQADDASGMPRMKAAAR